MRSRNPPALAGLEDVNQELVGDIQHIYDRLQITPQQLREFCQKWQIAELAVFGSILRDDFRVDGEDPSDIDFLFSYLPGYQLKAKTPIRSRSQPARVSADLPVHFISPYVGSHLPDTNMSLLRRSKMKIEIEYLCQRSVDLMLVTEVIQSHNLMRKKHILESARIIYAH